jgi:hypothetical protein
MPNITSKYHSFISWVFVEDPITLSLHPTIISPLYIMNLTFEDSMVDQYAGFCQIIEDGYKTCEPGCICREAICVSSGGQEG